jgi:hypothetical protein
MFAQQNKLKELFGINGWELIETQKPKDDWLVEIWLIKSNWSPTDCFAFIEFWVDDQWEEKANRLKGVNSIILSLQQPQIWQNDNFDIKASDNESIRIYIKPNFEKYIPEIFEALNSLRLKFKSLSN